MKRLFTIRSEGNVFLAQVITNNFIENASSIKSIFEHVMVDEFPLQLTQFDIQCIDDHIGMGSVFNEMDSKLYFFTWNSINEIDVK